MKAFINDYKDDEEIWKIANSLLRDKVKTSTFDLLPKVISYKSLMISSVDCHTSRISEFVDNYIRLAVTYLNSCVKEETDFIKK